MNTKHTPAPWKITEEIGDNPINSIIRTLDGRLISRTYGINPEEIEATTKLIAAAPELLEALIEGFNMADKLRFPTESELNQFKELAKAAIKKATE